MRSERLPTLLMLDVPGKIALDFITIWQDLFIAMSNRYLGPRGWAFLVSVAGLSGACLFTKSKSADESQSGPVAEMSAHSHSAANARPSQGLPFEERAVTGTLPSTHTGSLPAQLPAWIEKPSELDSLIEQPLHSGAPALTQSPLEAIQPWTEENRHRPSDASRVRLPLDGKSLAEARRDRAQPNSLSSANIAAPRFSPWQNPPLTEGQSLSSADASHSLVNRSSERPDQDMRPLPAIPNAVEDQGSQQRALAQNVLPNQPARQPGNLVGNRNVGSSPSEPGGAKGARLWADQQRSSPDASRYVLQPSLRQQQKRAKSPR